MAPDHHQEPAQRARNSGQSELVLYPVLNPRLNANRAVAVVLLSSHGEGQRHGQCARCDSTHCRAILPGSLHHLRAALPGREREVREPMVIRTDPRAALHHRKGFLA